MIALWQSHDMDIRDMSFRGMELRPRSLAADSIGRHIIAEEISEIKSHAVLQHVVSSIDELVRTYFSDGLERVLDALADRNGLKHSHAVNFAYPNTSIFRNSGSIFQNDFGLRYIAAETNPISAGFDINPGYFYANTRPFGLTYEDAFERIAEIVGDVMVSYCEDAQYDAVSGVHDSYGIGTYASLPAPMLMHIHYEAGFETTNDKAYAASNNIPEIPIIDLQLPAMLADIREIGAYLNTDPNFSLHKDMEYISLKKEIAPSRPDMVLPTFDSGIFQYVEAKQLYLHPTVNENNRHYEIRAANPKYAEPAELQDSKQPSQAAYSKPRTEYWQNNFTISRQISGALVLESMSFANADYRNSTLDGRLGSESGAEAEQEEKEPMHKIKKEEISGKKDYEAKEKIPEDYQAETNAEEKYEEIKEDAKTQEYVQTTSNSEALEMAADIAGSGLLAALGLFAAVPVAVVGSLSELEVSSTSNSSWAYEPAPKSEQKNDDYTATIDTPKTSASLALGPTTPSDTLVDKIPKLDYQKSSGVSSKVYTTDITIDTLSAPENYAVVTSSQIELQPSALAGTDIRRVRPRLESLVKDLYSNVEKIKKEHGYSSLQVSVVDLADGSSHGIDKDAAGPAPCILKIPVLVALLERLNEMKLSTGEIVEADEESLNLRLSHYTKNEYEKRKKENKDGKVYFTLQELLEPLIVRSDNGAYNLILKWLGNGDYNKGIAYVNKIFEEKGYDFKVKDINAIDHAFEGSTVSSDAVTRMMAELFKGTYSNSEINAVVLGLLEKSTKHLGEMLDIHDLPSTLKIYAAKHSLAENNYALTLVIGPHDSPEQKYVITIRATSKEKLLEGTKGAPKYIEHCYKAMGNMLKDIATKLLDNYSKPAEIKTPHTQPI